MNESENTDENSVCILSRLSLLNLHVSGAFSDYSSKSFFNEIILPNYANTNGTYVQDLSKDLKKRIK